VIKLNCVRFTYIGASGRGTSTNPCRPAMAASSSPLMTIRYPTIRSSLYAIEYNPAVAADDSNQNIRQHQSPPLPWQINTSTVLFQ
jgi:hypothetical protein